MRHRSPTLAFFLWGLVCFLSLPLIHYFQNLYFEKKEPLFICAVPNQNGQASLRSDGYGKGYFGASRNGGRIHQGIDLLAAVGKPVYAAKSGRVVFAGGDNKGYGQHIEVLHPNGFRTLYAHLSSLNIKQKDWVRQGEVIGKTGKTGNAKSHNILPHLHFEVRDQKKAINPAPFLNYKLV